MSSPTPSGCASAIAIIAKGKVAFDGGVDEARARLRPIVRLRTRASEGTWRSAIPASARREGGEWVFELPEGGPEPLLKALIDGGAGIETLAIERPGLHDAFVAIAGDAAAAAMGAGASRNDPLAPLQPSSSRAATSRATVLSKAFIFFLLGPLFPLLLGGVFGGIGARVATQTQRPVVAVVSSHSDFDRLSAARDRLHAQRPTKARW